MALKVCGRGAKNAAVTMVLLQLPPPIMESTADARVLLFHYTIRRSLPTTPVEMHHFSTRKRRPGESTEQILNGSTAIKERETM